MSNAPTHEPNRIEAVFGETLRAPQGDRAAVLSRLCAGDNALKSQVEGLLRAHDAASGGGFFAEPTAIGHPAGATLAAHSPLREGPGTRIGPYKILQLIGEGGFGVVHGHHAVRHEGSGPTENVPAFVENAPGAAENSPGTPPDAQRVAENAQRVAENARRT